jgi:hypothetical protein
MSNAIAGTNAMISTHFRNVMSEGGGSGGFGSGAAQAALDGNRMPNGSINMDGLAQHVTQNLGNESYLAQINDGLSPLQQGELSRLTGCVSGAVCLFRS